MRRTLTIAGLGIGAGTVAVAATMAAGVASAAPGSASQAAAPAGHAAAVVSVNKHITRAQAVRIAEAKVPHSRAIEVQSDDHHDRAVWKVTLATPHGRVVVDVDKRTGKATIVRNGGGGHGDALAATGLSGRSTITVSSSGIVTAWSGRDARDHDNDRGDDRGRDQRDNDHGDQHGRGHDDNRGHDRGDHDRGDH